MTIIVERNAAILAALEAHAKRVKADRTYSADFLVKTGIYNRDGGLTPEYGGPARRAVRKSRAKKSAA